MGRRKIEFGGHGAPSRLDSIRGIRRAFPCRRTEGTSIHPRDHPLLFRERIGRIEDEAATITQIQFGGGPRGIDFRPPIRSELLEVVPPDGVGRDFDGLHRLDVKWRVRRRWQSDDRFPQAVKS
jgi:hypothetical protein